MKNIVFSFLICCSLVHLHAEDLTQEQKIEQALKLLKVRNAFFCTEKLESEKSEELAPCKHSVQQLLDLILGRTESLVPMISMQNSDDFHAWLEQQENTLLMVSKPGCMPCMQAHAFISGYLDQNCLKTHVVGIHLVQAYGLSAQGVSELKNIEGTPEFFVIRNGKVTQHIHGLNEKQLRGYVQQHLT